MGNIFYTVPVICAWCSLVMGEKAGFTTNFPTHGICEACFKEYYPEMEYPLNLQPPEETI